MSKIWIVNQQSESRKPVKVAAFADKRAAAEDCCARLMAAPDGTWFWIESVSIGEPAVSAFEEAASVSEEVWRKTYMVAGGT